MAANMQSAQESIATYIRAKDQNQPHLMKHAFAEAATLEMVVRTGSISFPPISTGLESISDVLVRRFAQTYENVHTFCLAAPPQTDEVTFSCSWLVGMSEKESRMVRVGCGTLRLAAWTAGPTSGRAAHNYHRPDAITCPEQSRVYHGLVLPAALPMVFRANGVSGCANP